jgi:hypothetical protein
MHPHRYNNNKKKKKVMKDVKERIFIDGVNDWRRGGELIYVSAGCALGKTTLGRERERSDIGR